MFTSTLKFSKFLALFLPLALGRDPTLQFAFSILFNLEVLTMFPQNFNHVSFRAIRCRSDPLKSIFSKNSTGQTAPSMNSLFFYSYIHEVFGSI